MTPIATVHDVIDAFERKERGILQAHVAANLVAELRAALLAQQSEQVVEALPLTKLDELARHYSESYASPHHFTLSVEGLRRLIAAAVQKP
jgi:hypothetical protein